MNGPRKLLAIAAFTFLIAGFSSATDIYIAQNAAGSNDGSSCSNAFAKSYLDTSSNWKAGNTYHLCGTFTAAAGTNGYINVGTSGTSSSPVTVLAEPGLVLQAPYWGQNGAINTNSHSYLILNGNNAGTIQATANGTNLANQAPNCGGNLVCTSGIYAAACGNCTIENWTIANIYVNVGPNDESVAGEGSHGIFFNDGNNTTITGNTIHDMKWGISAHFCGDSNWTISNNFVYNIDHGVAVFSDNTGCSLTSLTISGNTIHDFAMWDDINNNNHHDGIHISPTATSTSIKTAMIYNNYIYGDPGAHGNAAFFMEGTPGVISNLQIVNNVYVNTSTSDTWADAVINEGIGNIGVVIANNTLAGSTTAQGTNGAGIAIETNDSSANPATIQNNIIQNFNRGIYVNPGSTTPTTSNNDYYSVAYVGSGSNGNTYSTLSSWQSYCGCDTNSVNGNPLLNGTQHLTSSSSAAWQNGADLTGLNIVSLDSDKAGVARPPFSPPNWDIGAYYDSGSGSGPNPPTGLSALVQ